MKFEKNHHFSGCIYTSTLFANKQIQVLTVHHIGWGCLISHLFCLRIGAADIKTSEHLPLFPYKHEICIKIGHNYHRQEVTGNLIAANYNCDTGWKQVSGDSIQPAFNLEIQEQTEMVLRYESIDNDSSDRWNDDDMIPDKQ